MESLEYVLISAHHCAPNMGSEHATGWNLVSRLSLNHPILLITEDNEFRPVLEDAIEDLRNRGACIELFFVHHGYRTDGRKNSLRILYYLTYRIYQKNVLKLAKKLKRKFKIKAVHHLTIHGFREPGFLWSMGLPFIWGPVGIVYAPFVLFDSLSLKMKIFQSIRNILTWTQFNFSPRVRSAYLASQASNGVFIASNPESGDLFVKKFGGRYTWIPETGSNEVGHKPLKVDRGGPLRLLWVGALVDRKPLGILLQSIAKIPDHENKIKLTVIGDGDSRQRYENQAKTLGVSVIFQGWLPHSEVITKFKSSELFVMFSINDGTPNVIFEALSAGVPVMCFDHHGYSFIVDDSCGIKLKIGDEKSLQELVVSSLISLCSNREKLNFLSQGAFEKSKKFNWDCSAQKILNIYQKLS